MEPLDLLRATATYAAYIFIPLVLLIGSYRILFHPLRAYPGPLLGRLTDAYSGYFAARKRLHLATYRNLQKYGPVMRQAPDRLVFNTITAVHDIYLNPRVTKGEAYRKSQLRAKFPSLLNAIDKEQHRRKRKFVGQALTERSMRTFEPTMGKHVDVFLRQLLASCQGGRPVDMTERCQRLGVDIIGQLGFGYPFNTQTEDAHRFVFYVIDTMSWRINTYMHFSPLSPFEMLFTFFDTRLAKFGRMIQTMIKARMAQDKHAHHDLYSILADHIGKGQGGMHRAELWPEAIFFIMAGGLTTSSTMSACFFYLSRNPKCYAALASEIRSTFASAGEIRSGPLLTSCKYLRACIDEAMRISPPTLLTLWRQQEPGGGDKPFVVDGHVIPRGTQVGVNLYALLHKEEYFPEPFAYRPERWLDSPADTEAEREARATMRKAFVPFIVGDRSCAGKAMAYLEASLTLARTLWYFDFEAAPGKAGELGGGTAGRTDGRGRPDEFQLEDIFVAGHQGPNIVFRTRGEFWKELAAGEKA